MESKNSKIEAEMERLKEAMNKKDDITIIDVVTKNNKNQREDIIESYKSKYNQDFFGDLKKATSGYFRDVCIALFTPPVDYDCECLYKAMNGAGTDEDTLIEIIATRKPQIMKQINERYSELYAGKELSEDIQSETSGSFGKLLVALVEGERSSNKIPNDNECEEYARKFNDYVENNSKDETIINDIFLSSSPFELAHIAKAYYNLTGKTILVGIEKRFSGDMKNLLKTLVYGLLATSEYFATRIYNSIKGLGTNEKILNRVLISRFQIDMPRIVAYYKKLYNVELSKDIIGDTRGSYQKILLKMAGY